MYCSECGVQNSDGATHCTNCGSILMAAPQPPQGQTVSAAVPEPKTCGIATAAFIMGLLSLTCILWPLMVLPAIICGIIALVKISKNKSQLKGSALAITGIVIPSVMLLLLPILSVILAILMPALVKTRTIAQQVVCGTNLKKLSLAMFEYTTDFEGQYPPLQQWSDLLIQEAAVMPESFHCSLDMEGAFSYAVNEAIYDVRLTQVKGPAQVVMFFEASLGRNGAGGQDDLVLRHDDFSGLGCNIAFADGHVEFVTESRIGDLQWTVEE